MCFDFAIKRYCTCCLSAQVIRKEQYEAYLRRELVAPLGGVPDQD